MNQSILFSDDVQWNEETQTILFSAQQMGNLIQCHVAISWLESESGEVIINDADALRVFEEYRFDVEEQAEALIEDEEFNASGEIIIN
ncbi:hypothetical protein A6E05_11180 [Aliivibrio sp. 1S165]|uniref:DUF1488 domain-containing protein n=1 Tax=unclassified Aliivibrio TaxID=2645654 RepID=UPI00080E873A|nr:MULTISPECIES: DUF1488 domain-containing protein [unclassified Aliivibrio]OCH12125.1 hypothetical protein A6E05_11180 [Aliivibrio sp. 1S165]OCH36051.1 hypothetical protein A6E06_11910 [Aliivibrio sp. 1S175]